MRHLRDDISKLLGDVGRLTNVNISEIDGKVKFDHVSDLKDYTWKPVLITVADEQVKKGEPRPKMVTDRNNMKIFSYIDDPYKKPLTPYDNERVIRSYDVDIMQKYLLHELVHIVDGHYCNSQGIEEKLLDNIRTHKARIFNNKKGLKKKEMRHEEMMILQESHAELIENIWWEEQGKEPEDPGYEVQDFYKVGQPLIIELYKQKIPMNVVFRNVPKMEEYKDIKRYFKRLGR